MTTQMKPKILEADKFELYLLDKIQSAEEFSNASKDIFNEVAWDMFQEELKMILRRYYKFKMGLEETGSFLT